MPPIINPKFKSKDFKFIFIYCIYLFIFMYIYLLLTKNFLFGKFNSYVPEILITFIANIFQLAPIIIFLKYKKEKLSSINFRFKNPIKIILIGLLLSIPLIILNKLFDSYNPQINLAIIFNQLIQVALVEEIIFRGFLQNKLMSIFNNKYKVSFAVGLLFSLSHLPNCLIFRETIDISVLIYLLIVVGTHIYLCLIASKGNSILSSTIAHFLNNIM